VSAERRAAALPEHPPEPVVAEREAERIVVARAADVRPVDGRRELDRGDPDARDDGEDAARREQVTDARAPRKAREDQVGERETGYDDPGGEHLRVEREPGED